MDLTTLKSLQSVYPKYISKYKELLNDPNVDIDTKINCIIQGLNQTNLTFNQLITNWNQVMQWAMNDGLDQAVITQMNAIVADGQFQTTLNNIVSKEGDLTKLTIPAPDLVTAINGNTTQLADIVTDVKAKGADSTGVSDSTTIIQNAINSLTNGGVVYFPTGTYLLGKITVPNNVSLKGAGIGNTTLKANANTGANYLVQLGSNSFIEDLTIDGNQANRTSLNNNTNASSLVGVGISNTVIRRCQILNSPGAGIFLYASSDVWIENNIIKNGQSNGLLCSYGCKTIRVVRNHVENNANQDGIFFMYDGAGAYDILIDGNYVKSSGDFGIEVGDHVPDGGTIHQYVRIINNYVEASTNAGIALRSVSHGIVENNQILGWGSGYGGNGIFVEGENILCSNVRVANNTLKQNTAGTADAIYVTGITDGSVINNHVENSNGNGILIDSPSFSGTTTSYPNSHRLFHNINVQDNYVTGTASGKWGIMFQGYGSQNLKAVGNIVESNNGGAIALNHYSTCNNASVKGNIIKRNKSIGLYVQSNTAVNISENIFTENNYGSSAGSAIYLNASDMIIIGNQFHDYQGTPTQTQRYFLNNAHGINAINNQSFGVATSIAFQSGSGNDGQEVLPIDSTGKITVNLISGTTITTKSLTAA